MSEAVLQSLFIRTREAYKTIQITKELSSWARIWSYERE